MVLFELVKCLVSAETFKIPVDEIELKTDSNYKQGSIENLYIPNKVNWLEIRPGGEIVQ